MKQKALIVENRKQALKALNEAVFASGFIAEACDSCEAGWTFFEKESPPLVIIEWHMQDEAAPVLCRQIKESDLGRYCTILIVANRNPAVDQIKALKAGASYCMDRPIGKANLEEWLLIARQNMDDFIAIEQAVSRVDQYKQELGDVNEQLEKSIERANKLAMAAEGAYVEINQIFKTVSGGIALINNNCEVIRHNETFLAMTGVNAGEAKGRKCSETFHAGLCETRECPKAMIKEGKMRVERQVEQYMPDGKKVYYSVVSTPFRGLAGELLGMVEHISDATARVQAELALKKSEVHYRELSIVDELTVLFNKRHFNEILRRETKRARRHNRPLTMIMMDIDNFKHFNDTYGHAEGDRVIAIIGKIVADSIRTTDYGNRYGGEEFTVILPDTMREDSIMVAERIRQTFAAHDFHPGNGERVNKTVSLGITQFLDEDTPNSFLERADKNLYKAKNQGKNRYVID